MTLQVEGRNGPDEDRHPEADPRLGLGLAWRPETAGLVVRRPDITFTEVLAESMSTRRRDPMPLLLRSAQQRGVRVAVHSVSLSLGGVDPPDRGRLRHLARLAETLDAPIVSDHAAFVRAAGREVGHLLPVPRSRAALDVLVRNVKRAQSTLPVPLAIENPASVFAWPDDELDEAAFLGELVERTGCLLLLDLANLHVNATNHGFDPVAFLDRLPLEAVAYVHVAGGEERGAHLHDTHRHPLWPEVDALVHALASRTDVSGIVLERDGAFPPDTELHAELDRIAIDAKRSGRRR